MSNSISYSNIWKIAYPIIIGSVAQNILNVIDTAFLGHLGEVALGGGAIGGLFYMTLVMLGWGFGVGTQILVARRNGERQYRAIGRTVEHGYLFLMGLALLLFFSVKLFGNQLLSVIVDSDNILKSSKDYIQYRIWGIFFAHTNFLFRAFYVGISRTKVITYTTLIMVVVNVFLDYSLIFGAFGFPEMGVAGAALASVISEASASIAFTLYTLWKIPLKKYRLFSFKFFSVPLLMRTLKVSLPMMLQNFLGFAVWFVFFLIIEKQGESQLAISNIIRSIYIILMVPIMGFSSANNSLVSYAIGKGNTDEVLVIIKRVIVLAVSSVLVIVIPASIFAEQLLSIYTNDLHLIRMGVPLIYLISFSSVLLGMANILFSGVSGTGKTRVSLTLEVFALLIYVSYTFVMVGYFKVNIVGAWTVEIVYAIFLSLFSYSYLSSRKWVGAAI